MTNSDLLKKSPLFSMSLSSKELFHTNFITWALENDEDDISKQVFFALFNENASGKMKVEREKDNIDILISVNNKKYIIENKVKDIIKEQQARKIESIAADTYLLLTLISNKPYFNMEKWKFLDYSVFINRSKNVKTKNKYLSYLFSDYINMVELLIETIMENIEYNKYNFVLENSSVMNIYKNLRVHDLFIKFYASRLLAFIVNDLSNKNKLIQKGYEFKPTFGFSNNHAIVDIFWENEMYTIGIQIEEKYYRKILMLKVNKTEAVAAKLRHSNIWFSSTWLSHNKKAFCSYDSNKQSPTFIYQYENTYLTKDTTFQEICQKIHKTIKEIYDNHENIKSICTEVLTIAST